ncbi:DEAD/DEAH box helicase family protein [Shewanella abyssi]|uniref:DEAD/DEAH box helicase family protein n=1 Tax=Shewanella abyssi TaxID=311789 RepID=UPI00200E8377|nr:DEAD/DEAH box helicase family protein [Shewanella abyssi]MCL1051878.1 DEAD/DEAH box helicase family protein [Shewanella abyssi]
MARFENKLVLGHWMLKQFGVESLEVLGKTLSAEHLIGFDEENSSKYLYELLSWIPEANRAVKDDFLRQYDDNIVKHWRDITDKRNHAGNTLYPLYFQYLSVLFTEHYLDRYFNDKAALCSELNHYLVDYNQEHLKQKGKNAEAHYVEPFKESDLNKLAVWIATGGGKTLIMHVNILQFEHYKNKYKKAKDFNRTILLTPNSGLSLQHKSELDASGFDGAKMHDKSGQMSLSGGGIPIDIIDIHKLQDSTKKVSKKLGEKSVDVAYFESNNLVLVDEGHRGASGTDWMVKRNQICESGFSFEYSATFGQAIKAASGNDIAPKGVAKPSAKYKLTQQYAKCILFDYSYKFFHGDGYGKDHFILNLSESWGPDQLQLYLTGCILNFYQQKKVFKDKEKTIAEYLLADPLWIFVGGKVTAKNEANAETVSDIQAIMQFVARFVANNDNESEHFIELFLNQQDDLRDGKGTPIFEGSFTYLQKEWASNQASSAFIDVLRMVFNTEISGMLHVVHLKGSGGEIGLRVGENDWFGVVNVGDSAKLINLCDEAVKSGNIEHTVVTDQSFSSSLFHNINKKGSPINLLIGAKKFTEGWSSWRVSTMGLMNVGRSEGSEIIQLFGRGVRLKGLDFSLKRSNHIPGMKHPKHLPLLETLNVFGIRSDYMKEFEEYLEEEGVGEQTTEVITLPVIKRLTRTDLKLIRLDSNIVPFKKAKKPFLENQPVEMKGKVTLNWYPKIQAKRSVSQSSTALDVRLNEGIFEEKHLAFLKYDDIYFELAQYKNEKAWYNLQLGRNTIRELLSDPSWYRLLIPADMMEVTTMERVQMWQEIATALIKKYVERYYHFRKSEYEGPHLEYYQMSDKDDNFIDNYKATVDRNADEWINKINELKDHLQSGTFRDSWSFGNLKVFDFSKHLYQPLIYFKNNEVVKLSPVPVNEGERDFIEDLKHFCVNSPEYFEDKELFVLRNQSKGKGVGFFEAGNFYPDFIIWLIVDNKQYVCFVDPKGLARIHGFDDAKIKFYKTIKDIQTRLGDPDIVLDSFIVSNTYQREINWWTDGSGPEQSFENNHVLFQKEDKANYIKKIFVSLLGA